MFMHDLLLLPPLFEKDKWKSSKSTCFALWSCEYYNFNQNYSSLGVLSCAYLNSLPYSWFVFKKEQEGNEKTLLNFSWTLLLPHCCELTHILLIVIWRSNQSLWDDLGLITGSFVTPVFSVCVVIFWELLWLFSSSSQNMLILWSHLWHPVPLGNCLLKFILWIQGLNHVVVKLNQSTIWQEKFGITANITYENHIFILCELWLEQDKRTNKNVRSFS